MKYSLVIIRSVGSESNTVAVDADGDVCGGVLILHYNFDGAEYSLEIGGGEMIQRRFGAINMFMRFACGQTTAARFNDGVNGGEFPVFTRRLKIEFDGTDCKAECEFDYGDGGEIISLSVTASMFQ